MNEVTFNALSDELTKLGRGNSASRRWRRPMKVTTLLKKEKASSMEKYTKAAHVSLIALRLLKEASDMPGTNETYSGKDSANPREQPGDVPSREGTSGKKSSGGKSQDRLNWEDGHSNLTVVPGPTANAFSSETGPSPRW